MMLALRVVLASAALVAVPAMAQQGASLSSGFRSGMTPEQVAQVLNDKSDIKAAKVGGSKASPRVDIKYINDNSTLNGWDFRYEFSFVSGRLAWVDLVGFRDCVARQQSYLESIRLEFGRLYGEPDAAGVYTKGNTKIFLMKKDYGPAVWNSPSLQQDMMRRNEETRARCGEYEQRSLIIRYKDNSPPVLNPMDPASIAIARKAAAEAALKAAAQKKADEARLRVD